MDPRRPPGSESASSASANEIDSFTQGFVRKCARNLIGKCGFLPHDREDIEQRLYLKLAKQLRFAKPDDPQWKAFVAVTVRHHIINLIRDRGAAKRDDLRTCSIHVRIGAPDDPVELSATLIHREVPSRRGRNHRTEQEYLELMLDVSECIADVPDRQQRELLERLKWESVAQAARAMQIPTDDRY